MITFACPRCGLSLKAPPHKCGASVRCPQCRGRVRVPEEPSPVTVEPQSPPTLSATPRRQPGLARAGGPSPVVWSLAALFVCMSVGALGLALVVSLGGWLTDNGGAKSGAVAETSHPAEATVKAKDPAAENPVDKPPDPPAARPADGPADMPAAPVAAPPPAPDKPPVKPAPAEPQRMEYLVVALPGDSGQATAQLNKLADQGWQVFGLINNGKPDLSSQVIRDATGAVVQPGHESWVLMQRPKK